MFAFMNFDVKPDIVTFAKGVTCGYIQLGGACVSKEIAAYFVDHTLSCCLTYFGHPLACAAGVACVNYYTKANILDNVNKVGAVLAKKLDEFKEKYITIRKKTNPVRKRMIQAYPGLKTEFRHHLERKSGKRHEKRISK